MRALYAPEKAAAELMVIPPSPSHPDKSPASNPPFASRLTRGAEVGVAVSVGVGVSVKVLVGDAVRVGVGVAVGGRGVFEGTALAVDEAATTGVWEGAAVGAGEAAEAQAVSRAAVKSREARRPVEESKYPMTFLTAQQYHSSFARRCGKRITSRMVDLSVSSMVRRSIPIPNPPLGGIP